jgi:crossover junction endodeoxyribonuclease RusA
VPASRPDIDKLARAVLDALTGVAFRDDSQVAKLDLLKLWVDAIPPGVQVIVWAID